MRDEKAFDEIFRLYYRQLFYFANQYIPDPDDCHDILSAVFEGVWRNFEDVHQDTVKSFLFSNVKNKCIDFLRHQNLHARYVDFVNTHSESYIDAREYDQQEEHECAIAKVLDGIGEPTRSILVACYVDGKKYRQVADEMKISVSTVKKHMVRALRMIRERKRQQ